MSNLFPQQRLFAIIIFISFCLHTALFISGTAKQTAKSRVYKSERILTRLSNEFAFPLVYKDRVSLSVIANSYAREYDINRIVIRNANDEVLVQSGIDPMLGGEKFATDINVNKKTIGNIEITLKSVSNGEIVKFLWLFIVTSLIIHLGVWFLYLNFSNPTEEDLQKIRDEAYEEFLQKNQPIENQSIKENELAKTGEKLPESTPQRERKQAPKKVLMELADYIIEYKQNKTVITDNQPQEEAKKAEKPTPIVVKKPAKVTANADEDKVKAVKEIKEATEKETNQEQVSEKMNTSNKIIGATKGRAGTTKIPSSKKVSILFPKNPPKPTSATSTNKVEKPARNIIQVKQSSLIKKHHDRQSLLNSQPSFTKLVLEFKYVDKYKLLEKVMPAVVTPYYELCSQLLQIAINQLLTDKRLQGIKLVNQPTFSIQGAKVELATTNNNQTQLLLASTMLANLYQMINQVVYEARREAKLFAFNMNIGISYTEQESVISELNEFNEHENVIVSLQYNALKLIKDKVTITKNTEQKYNYVNNMTEDLLLTLIRIRNKILEME